MSWRRVDVAVSRTCGRPRRVPTPIEPIMPNRCASTGASCSSGNENDLGADAAGVAPTPRPASAGSKPSGTREVLGCADPPWRGDPRADGQLVEPAPSLHGAERVVGRRGDLPARRQPQPERRLATARERMGHGGRHHRPVVGQAPHRHVPLARGEQLAQGDLGVGVGAQHPGLGDEAARLAQVGEHRALVGTELQLAGQLGQRHHRGLELTGEDLEPTADLGHLDLAALGGAPSGHQLQVVDDDQTERRVEPVLEPSGLGADLGHGQGGVVVDPQLALAEAAHRLGDLGPVGVGQPARAELGRVDARLGRDESLGELEVAHLQREEQHRSLLAHRRVRRDAQREGRVVHEQVRGDEVVLTRHGQVVDLVVRPRTRSTRSGPTTRRTSASSSTRRSSSAAANRCRRSRPIARWPTWRLVDGAPADRGDLCPGRLALGRVEQHPTRAQGSCRRRGARSAGSRPRR